MHRPNAHADLHAVHPRNLPFFLSSLWMLTRCSWIASCRPDRNIEIQEVTDSLSAITNVRWSVEMRSRRWEPQTPAMNWIVLCADFYNIWFWTGYFIFFSKTNLLINISSYSKCICRPVFSGHQQSVVARGGCLIQLKAEWEVPQDGTQLLLYRHPFHLFYVLRCHCWVERISARYRLPLWWQGAPNSLQGDDATRPLSFWQVFLAKRPRA